jgi:hypothetical protein
MPPKVRAICGTMHERIYPGSCGCGATRVTLRSHLAPAEFQPRSDAESCEFCRRHQGIWISDPRGTLQIAADNQTTVSRFASGEVAFHFCAECGDLTYALCFALGGERQIAVVRRDLFAVIAACATPVTSTNFEGASLEDARKRRSQNWTPCEALGAL